MSLSVRVWLCACVRVCVWLCACVRVCVAVCVRACLRACLYATCWEGSSRGGRAGDAALAGAEGEGEVVEAVRPQAPHHMLRLRGAVGPVQHLRSSRGLGLVLVGYG